MIGAPDLAALRQRASGWRLRRRVGVFFALLVALFAGLAAASVISLVEFVHQDDQVVHRWGPAAGTGESLLSDLVDQETGVRGYALSGDARSLTVYEQHRAQERHDVAALQRLVSGDRALQADLAAVQRAAARWRNEVAIPLISLVNAHDSGAQGVAGDPQARQRFDEIRSASAALAHDIARRNRQAGGARYDAMVALYVSLAVTAALLVAAALLAWRGLHSWVLTPVDRLAAQTREVAGGKSTRVIRPVGPPELRALSRDVETMRRRIVAELKRLERTGEELTRSNADLEQFAYVASHDLSEPLRKVANFCQLLERQYGSELDDRAREYIGYAVDGAKRMQALIADLLLLSRVGRTADAFVPVDTGQALAAAVRNLDEQIVASGGGVGHSELPTVPGDPTLLTSLFENLVGNAVKYRSDEPPLVVVTAVEDRDEGVWTFSVEDNGIGIDPQYEHRVFAIFQRLHLRDAYPGTGIGLALCRKIVEFHGGRIWLDTSVSSGTTFRFTLPSGARE